MACLFAPQVDSNFSRRAHCNSHLAVFLDLFSCALVCVCSSGLLMKLRKRGREKNLRILHTVRGRPLTVCRAPTLGIVS